MTSSIPTPHNTIVISTKWMFIGAVLTTVMWYFIQDVDWIMKAPRLIKENILYAPLLVLNLIAHAASYLKPSGNDNDTNKPYYEIYVSSLIGAIIGIFLRYCLTVSGI